MNTVRRLALFAMIAFFSGSMVFVAGKDLEKRLGKHSEEDKVTAQGLVKALRGDVLAEKGEQYIAPNNLPSRVSKSVLPDQDQSRIRSFLVSLLGLSDNDSKK